MLFQFYPQIFYRIEVRALWWPLQYLDFVVLIAILPQLWKYPWGHCQFGGPIYNLTLTSWLMSWEVASIYPHNVLSSWCHLFCEVHQSLLQQSTPTTWCCHPVLHGLQASPNITIVIMAKEFYFCFIRPVDISPKSKIFVPMCNCKP